MNTKNILITGARAPVTVRLIRSLKKDGHRIFITDSTHLVIAKKSKAIERFIQTEQPNKQPEKYIGDLNEIIEREKINFVIPLCEEVFFISKYKNKLKTHIFVDQFEKLECMHHKGKFTEWMATNGFCVPKSAYVKNKEQLHTFLTESGTDTFILKKAYSRFAHGIQKMTKEEVMQFQQFPIIVQEFIVGREWCTYSIAVEDGVTTAIYPSDFHYRDSATIYYENTQFHSLIDIVEKIIQHLDWYGQIAFDVIECEKTKKMYFIECNPRATSGALFMNGETWFSQQTPEVAAYQLMPMMWIKWLRTPTRSLYTKIKQAKDVFGLADGIGLYMWQFRVLLGWYFIARKLNCTMSEATTKDIEWNGEALE